MSHKEVRQKMREYLNKKGIDRSYHFAVMKFFAVDYCQYPPKLPTGFVRMGKLCLERWDEFDNYVENEIDYELIDEIIP